MPSFLDIVQLARTTSSMTSAHSSSYVNCALRMQGTESHLLPLVPQIAVGLDISAQVIYAQLPEGE